jgi:hypothetical protein
VSTAGVHHSYPVLMEISQHASFALLSAPAHASMVQILAIRMPCS